ncbi:3-phosphoshikimate 1-carboxyvinyltransferase [Promicromonospora thailandica]|uniref:3-phosphoshikimate 1-carboxyvinyltransferase n=1 Tax=Promicromonospora thailandica TaxID=765201 RepID=A0A9X2FXW0_9MICO|nr:3-phosphoshikimate 1-carboxyvinyltransferase [Promicromonospora thailandica]MCP2263159.1 3-phosphoshikimate 1-carboxyvinyltransferase [Promicromonospora thailandica]BFF18544.1 3-phosphoshikimate 1-carboxyvinyltransferase [Promicromonospora thailandica]
MTSSTTAPAPAWEAPLAGAPLDATVEIPGSKSLTNRLLVLAALADAPGTLRGALRSRDADLMIGALRALGAGIAEGDQPSTLHVTPGPVTGDTDIDTGLAGTVMRFLPPFAALADGPVRFDGDAAARVRPMLPVLAALHALGVTVHGPDGADEGELPAHLPFTVEGRGHVAGGAVDVDASQSSQFVSGLLLAAARFERGLTLRHIGATLPSLPHIEMTVATLRDVGVEVDDSRDGMWHVAPGPIAARDVRVEPDLSNAAPFLAAALVAGGTVRVPGWPTITTQPGAMVPELLERMGGTYTLADGVLSVTGTGAVHGIDVDLHAGGELAPTFAALAALADSPSRLRGIAHLRGHETDRLAALAREITRLGGQAEETRDGLVITPRPLRGDVVRTYEDHRMATSAALLGLRVPGVQVENVATTGKTLPGFTAMWQRMLGSDA